MSLGVHYDVAIIGGGVSGVAAAVAAAQNDLNVVLLESKNYLGGLAASAMVGTICGLYVRGKNEINDLDPQFAVRGFAKRFSEQVMSLSKSEPIRYDKNLFFIPYQLDMIFHQLQNELNDHQIAVQLNARVSCVKQIQSRIQTICFENSHQSEQLSVNAVVDCSGHAIVSDLLGLERLADNNPQSGAFVFKIAGLPDFDFQRMKFNIIRWIKKGIAEGVLSKESERLSIIPGTLSQGCALMKLGLPQHLSNISDDKKVLDKVVKKRCIDLCNYLKNVDSCMNRLKIIEMADEVGLRSSCRSLGEHVLLENHIINCLKPEDGVAVGAWPIEFWGDEKKPEMEYLPADDYYLIPAGCLISSRVENLFFGGRNISASSKAIASARVIGTSLGTGFAAGELAAGFVNGSDRMQTIKKIRQLQV